MATCSKKDPDAPKRPMSAFLAYSNKKRATLKRQNQYLNNGEMSKILSKAWKEESKEERQKYIDEARELRLKHKIAVKERNKEVRKLEKEKIKRQRKVQIQEVKRGEQARIDSENGNRDNQLSRSSRGSGKRKGKYNEKVTKSSAPKRPISAFLEYSNDKRAMLKRKNPSLSNADISKHLSDQWKAEEPDVRQGFLDAAYDRRMKHKSDMVDWHKSMEQQMHDQFQKSRTESSEDKDSDDITGEAHPTTSETVDIQDTSTATCSLGNISLNAIFSSNQGVGLTENTANLQNGFPNQSGTTTISSTMQSGSMSALHQPMNPFAVAHSSDTPSFAYVPVMPMPGNTMLPGYLPGSLPGSTAVLPGAAFNSNSASLAAVSYLPTVQDPATQFLNNNVGMNAVAVAAGALNTDSSLFVPPNATMTSAQSLVQNPAHLLSFQQNLAASGPSMGHGDGTVVANQQQMFLMCDNHGQIQSRLPRRAS